MSNQSDYQSPFNFRQFFQNKTKTPEAIENNQSFEDGHLLVDMFEKDNFYYIVAPVAGVQPDQIELELNDNFIVIKGRRQHNINPNTNYLVSECYWGEFNRRLDFPTTIDSERAVATFKEGMLTISLPFARSAQTKTLKIKTV